MPDNLSPAQRHYCMSRVKGRDTLLEQRVRSALHALGLRFRKHVKELPGKPDVVFTKRRVVVFIDGDFWHGYRFPAWRQKVTPFWQEKIENTRKRDQANFRKLRRAGWRVIRIWQHEVKHDFGACIARVIEAVAALSRPPPT